MFNINLHRKSACNLFSSRVLPARDCRASAEFSPCKPGFSRSGRFRMGFLNKGILLGISGVGKCPNVSHHPTTGDTISVLQGNQPRTLNTTSACFLSHKHEGRGIMVYVHTVKPTNNTPRRPVVVTEDGVVHFRLERPEQSRSENGHHCNHNYLPCNDLCKKQNEKYRMHEGFWIRRQKESRRCKNMSAWFPPRLGSFTTPNVASYMEFHRSADFAASVQDLSQKLGSNASQKQNVSS